MRPIEFYTDREGVIRSQCGRAKITKRGVWWTVSVRPRQYVSEYYGCHSKVDALDKARRVLEKADRRRR